MRIQVFVISLYVYEFSSDRSLIDSEVLQAAFTFLDLAAASGVSLLAVCTDSAPPVRGSSAQLSLQSLASNNKRAPAESREPILSILQSGRRSVKIRGGGVGGLFKSSQVAPLLLSMSVEKAPIGSL
ncbi:unnamed protein product [Pleuronectes platessa]|uniref:Uncharacterized protein n=1 Tax=Pleuronectes platessa TaxID=8262 RepID=A0A9N7YLK8_PLEPL|nr:unnamed protein product [Pleuronectes platessa]